MTDINNLTGLVNNDSFSNANLEKEQSFYVKLSEFIDNDYSKNINLNKDVQLQNFIKQQGININDAVSRLYSALIEHIFQQAVVDKSGKATEANFEALVPLEAAYNSLNSEPDNSFNKQIFDLEFVSNNSEGNPIVIQGNRTPTYEAPPGVAGIGGIQQSGGGYAISWQDENGENQMIVYGHKHKLNVPLNNNTRNIASESQEIADTIYQTQGRDGHDVGTQKFIKNLADQIVNHGLSPQTVRGWIAHAQQTHDAIISTVVSKLWHNINPPDRIGLDAWANGLQDGFASGTTADQDDIYNWAAHGTTNLGWIKGNEGGTLKERTQGYVPGHGQGVGRYSGVTAGYGVDLAHFTEQDLRSFGVNNTIINKIKSASNQILAPQAGTYGARGTDAERIVNQHGLNLTEQESNSLTNAVMNHSIQHTKSLYDKATGRPGSFDSLPVRARSVLGDLGYNMGENYGRTNDENKQNLWNDAVNGDWKSVVDDINELGLNREIDNNRRDHDANAVQWDINDGFLR